MTILRPSRILPAVIAGLCLVLVGAGPDASASPIGDEARGDAALAASPADARAADPRGKPSSFAERVAAPLVQDVDPATETDDMLGGKRRLADVRDLAILLQEPDDRQKPSSYRAGPVALRMAQDGTVVKEERWGIQQEACVPSVPDLWPYPFRQVGGRFHNTAYDMVLTVNGSKDASSGTCKNVNNAEWKLTELASSGLSHKNYRSSKSMDTRFFQLAVDDFDQDGFDDVFAVNEKVAFVASATDVESPSAGLAFFASQQLPNSGSESNRPIGDPATGDFNGDGLVDVAWLQVPDSCDDFANDCEVESLRIQLATVCPGSVAGTVCADKTRMQVVLSPSNVSRIDVVINDSRSTRGKQCKPAAAIAAGRFGTTTPGLAVASSFKPLDSDHCRLKVQLFTFTTNLRPSEVSSTIIEYLQEPLTVFATAARMDWFSGLDQLVIAAGGHRDRESSPMKYGAYVAVVDFDAQRQMMPSLKTTTDDSYLAGLAVGSFAEPSYDEATTVDDFAPKIAVLVERNGNNNRANRVRMYRALQVNGAYQLTLTSTYDYAASSTPSDFHHNYGGSRLAAVDVQGRSVVLGEPVVYEVSTSIQPTVILGAPPMHADYVQPVASTSEEPTVVNFSMLPSSFKSQYLTSTSNEESSSTTNKSSINYGLNFEYMLAGKTPAATPINVEKKFEFSAEYTHEKEKEVNRYSSSSQEYDASTKTALGDQIWFTRTGVRFFNYPVLGETACPDEEPSCADPGPVYMILSLPYDTTFATSNASGLEWYQPIHETGNVFSYPWDREQLDLRVGDIDLLSTETPTSFYTDESVREVEVNWRNAAGKEVSTGYSNEFATSLSYTYSTHSAGYKKAGGFKQKVTIGGSYGGAYSTLDVTDGRLAASTGFGIEKESTFQTPTLYQYLIQPYIFGQLPDPKKLDDANLDTDINTSGALQAAFVANPTAFGSGSWWKTSPYAQSFDVGLSHPARWKLDPTDYQSGILPPMCLYKVEVRTSADCVHLNQPEEDPWNSEFHWMKGLFLSVGDDYGDTKDPGSQRSIFVPGERVNVQARIYNFSMKDMGDARTKARIYRQEWNESTGEPEGPSVLLTEQDLGQIPAFAQSSDPNYVMASTSFEATADMEGKQYVFWVVTWVESPDGSLASELPGHGLASKPGDLTGLEQVDLEEVSFVDRLGQPVTQTFSNNVGLFRQLVTVVPSGGVPTAAQAGTQRADGLFQVGLQDPEVAVRDIELSEDVAALGDTVFVTADVHAIGASTAGVPVDFFDGDPHDGGMLFDVEMLSWIHGHRPHKVSAPYWVQTCGTHELYVVAEPDGDRRAHQSVTLEVPCDEMPEPRDGRIYLPVAWRDAPAGLARD